MLPKALQDLIDDLANLPGVGPKSAARIGFYLVNSPRHLSKKLADDLSQVHVRIKDCQICGNYTETEVCPICANPNRDKAQILVVETALDILAFEGANFKGSYHVLKGLISPLQGIGPEQINLEKLVHRVAELNKREQKTEVILATGTSLEGEATASYINKILSAPEYNEYVSTSRLARGLPSNSAIEYQDPHTLANSLENRVVTSL